MNSPYLSRARKTTRRGVFFLGLGGVSFSFFFFFFFSTFFAFCLFRFWRFFISISPSDVRCLLMFLSFLMSWLLSWGVSFHFVPSFLLLLFFPLSPLLAGWIRASLYYYPVLQTFFFPFGDGEPVSRSARQKRKEKSRTIISYIQRAKREKRVLEVSV